MKITDVTSYFLMFWPWIWQITYLKNRIGYKQEHVYTEWMISHWSVAKNNIKLEVREMLQNVQYDLCLCQIVESVNVIYNYNDKIWKNIETLM